MRKKLMRFYSLFCSVILLSVVCSIGIPIISNAETVFPYTLPSWDWANGGILSFDNSGDSPDFNQQFVYTYNRMIALTDTYGNLDGTKNYRILVNFNPTITISGTNTNSSSKVEYQLIVGGKVYNFGNSTWLYCDVSGVNTDYIIFQGVVTDTVLPAYSYTSGTRPTYSRTLRITDFSYNIIETEGISNPDLNQVNSSIEDGNEIAQDTNEAVTGFFDSFFGDLFETIYGLFIPEDDFFTDYFNDLKTLFNNKLGALWYPAQWLIDFIGQIYTTSSSVTTTIPFPDIAWDGVTILDGSNVRIIPQGFEDFQPRIFFVTDIIMIGSIFMLLQQKIKEVLEH